MPQLNNLEPRGAPTPQTFLRTSTGFGYAISIDKYDKMSSSAPSISLEYRLIDFPKTKQKQRKGKRASFNINMFFLRKSKSTNWDTVQRAGLILGYFGGLRLLYTFLQNPKLLSR